MTISNRIQTNLWQSCVGSLQAVEEIVPGQGGIAAALVPEGRGEHEGVEQKRIQHQRRRGQWDLQEGDSDSMPM